MISFNLVYVNHVATVNILAKFHIKHLTGLSVKPSGRNTTLVIGLCVGNRALTIPIIISHDLINDKMVSYTTARELTLKGVFPKRAES